MLEIKCVFKLKLLYSFDFYFSSISSVFVSVFVYIIKMWVKFCIRLNEIGEHVKYRWRT